MDLGAIRTAIVSWVESITDLPARWMERPQQYGADQILLHIRGFRGVGLDELTETYDETTALSADWGSIVGGYTPGQTGQRVGTLEIRAEVQSQVDDEDALYYVQLLRDRLSLPSCVDALDTAGAALGSILLEPRELSRTADLRRVSSAQMDVEINAAAAATDEPYGTIEAMDLTTVGQDADDATVFSVTRKIEV